MSNMFDAFKVLGKLGEMKKKATEVKKKLESIELSESSEDHLITIKLSANKVIKEISINENLLNPTAKDDLEKKLVEILNSGLQKADSKSKEFMKESLKDGLPDIPGLDMDNLPF